MKRRSFLQVLGLTASSTVIAKEEGLGLLESIVKQKKDPFHTARKMLKPGGFMKLYGDAHHTGTDFAVGPDATTHIQVDINGSKRWISVVGI